MMRGVLVVLAALAPFFFPWKFSVLLSFVASFFVPFSGLLTGVVGEALYYQGGLPSAFIGTLIAALIAYGVRAFARTRIIGA